MAQDFLSGFQVGANVVGNALDRNMRMQQLKSEQAIRQAEERRAAQLMEMKMEEYALQTQARAEANIALARADMESSPMVVFPNPMGSPISVPNPKPKSKELAYAQHMLPILAKYGGPEDVIKGVQSIATMQMNQEIAADRKLRTFQAGQPRPLTPEEAALKKQQTATSLSAEKLNEAKALKLKAEETAGGFSPKTGEVTLTDGTKVRWAQRSDNSVQYFASGDVKEITLPNGSKVNVIENSPGHLQIVQDVEGRQIRNLTRRQQDDMVKWVREKADDLVPKLRVDVNGVSYVPPELVEEVARRGGLNEATQTSLEGAQIAADDVFLKGQQLMPLVNERTTSGMQNLKRVLRDTPGSIFLPDSFMPTAETTEADATAREFMSSIVRQLKSDGNINKDEANALFNEANAIRWVNEKTGKSRIKSFVSGAVMKAREASIRLGKPINEKYLTIDEIGQRAEAMVEAGTPRAEASAWAKRTFDKSAVSFINNLNKRIAELEQPVRRR